MQTAVAGLGVLVALLTLPLVLARRAEAFIYWTTGESIGRANLDGTAIDESFIDLRHGDPTSLAVDARHIYWMSSYRMSSRQSSGTGSRSVRVPPAAPGAVGRARLDGTRVDQDFITGFDEHDGGALVALDDEHIYWTENFLGELGINQTAIARANLDASAVNREFVSPGSFAYGIAVDDNYIYWADGNAVDRASIDGTRIEQEFIPVPVPANSPSATLGAVEVDAGHVYWLNAAAGASPGSVQPTIARANLDGTAIDVSFIAAWSPTFAPQPTDVAVDAGHVYWTNGEPTNTIGRADLDGSNLDQHFITPANGADTSSVAVDALSDPRAEGRARAARTQRQTGRRIVVKVKVQAKEELIAKATGKIKVNATYKLRPMKVDLTRGETKRLKLKPKQRAWKIAKALKQGQNAKAKLTVELSDAVENREIEKLLVRLTG